MTLTQATAWGLAYLVCAGSCPAEPGVANKVVFGSDHDYPPFEYLDPRGQAVGFNVDLIRAIAKAADFEVEIRLGPWHEIRHALEVTGEVHIADMFYSTQRAQVVDFAQPNTLVHDQIFVHREHPDRCNWGNLKGAAVVVQRGSYMEDYFKSHTTGAQLISVDSEPEALRLIASGQHDCAIVGEIVGHYSIERLGLENLVSTGRPLFPREYSFVVDKGNHALLKRINYGLRAIKASGEYARLYNHWFGSGRSADLMQNIQRYLLWIAIPLTLLILVTLTYNRLLSRQINARTADLRAELGQRIRAERELRETEQRFRQLTDNIEEVMWIANPENNEILYISPAYETVWGRSCKSLYEAPLSFLDAIHPDDKPRVLQALERQVSGDYNAEYRVIRPDGSLRWVTDRGYPLRNEQGEVFRVVGIAQDITARKMAEARIEHLATRDPLTDLPNRYLLDDRIGQSLLQAQHKQERFAVLFIDLDNFKTINDSLGHSVGDTLLQDISRRIEVCLGKEDTLSRTGGDEFVALVKGLKRARQIAHVAHKILTAVSQPSQIKGHTLITSCSIGISIYPNDGTDVDTLLRNADTAMYHAKSSGRRNFQFFSPEMNARAVERLLLENDLRHAIQHQEFRLYYQAKINLDSGEIVGAEALLRWQHPRRGLLNPGLFIPLAEETGLIVPIGRWIIETAARQAQAWRAQGVAISIAINVSARQLGLELVKQLETVLTQHGFSGNCLELEITETVLMEHIQDNIGLLQHLHALGVHVSIDDFGTGYSSLSYLKRFPIHALKIDRSFVQDIETDSGSLAITKAIISLAHSLHLRVIAEGVENGSQLSTLRALEVDEFQGFLFNKPETAAAFEQRLIWPQRKPPPRLDVI